MAFSVPVTLVSDRVISLPLNPPGTVKFNSQLLSLVWAPSLRKASRWARTDRLPMMQPPGKSRRAFLKRASIGASRRMEARSFKTRGSFKARCFRFWALMVTVFLLNSVFAPSFSINSKRVRTSAICGTFLMTHFCLVNKQAAKIGSAAFLEPLTFTVPLSFWPPWIKNWGISKNESAFYYIPGRGIFSRALLGWGRFGIRSYSGFKFAA